MKPKTSAEIELLTIICNPLSPAPGDTTELTTQPVGKGGEPTFDWQVSGGTLIDNGAISVRWVAPTETGVYRVFVRASLGAAADTMSKYVMVRNIEAINTTVRYSYNPRLTDSDFFFIGSKLAAADKTFLGYHLYRLAIPVQQITKNTSPSVDGGFSFTFFPDVVLTSVVTNGAPALRVGWQPMNVIVFPLVFGPKVYVSNNEYGGTNYRKNQHVYPSASNDLGQFVWQYNKVGSSEDGSKDLVNILYRKSGAPGPTTLTIAKDSTFKYGGWFYRYYKNVHPMFTDQASNILYFCDTTKTRKNTPCLEPCIIPMGPSGPLTSQRHEVGGPGAHGIFYNANVVISDKTIFQWNPAVPTEVGFIDANGNFCLLDYAAEAVEIVSSVGKVKEFAWSEDGKAAVINNTGVLIVTPGGAPDTAFVKEEAGDDVFGVSWKPGSTDEKLAFRVVRKGVSAVETFCAIIIYSVDDHRWYYASPRISYGSEPTVDYQWLRAFFMGDDLYMPIPVPDGGGSVVIYHSY